MREKILTILKAHKGRAGYFGLTPLELVKACGETYKFNDCEKWIPLLEEMHAAHQIILTRSSRAADKGNVVLITYREDV